MDEDGQSLERGEVCTGTGSAIVSGRSKQAGAPSVSAQKLEGQPLQDGCCWRGPAGFSKQKDERGLLGVLRARRAKGVDRMAKREVLVRGRS